MSLNNLPLDILRIIVSKLHYLELYSLSHTSSRLYSLFRDLFWKERIRTDFDYSIKVMLGKNLVDYLELRFNILIKLINKEHTHLCNQSSIYDNQLINLHNYTSEINSISFKFMKRTLLYNLIPKEALTIQFFKVASDLDFPNSKCKGLTGGQICIWISEKEKGQRFAVLFKSNYGVERINNVFVPRKGYLGLTMGSKFLNFCKEYYLTKSIARQLYNLDSIIPIIQPYFKYSIKRIEFHLNNWV